MDADEKPLTQTERLALADRDSGGRFVKGHKKSSPGRPVGALNKITKSLREEVREGLGDIPTFIRELKKDYPPAAAGLLARMLPPADAADDAGGGGTVSVTIVPIRSGTFILDDIEPARVPSGLRLVIDRDAPADDTPDRA